MYDITFDFENAEFIGLTDKQIEIWRDLYKAVDVDHEIRKAAVWQQAHPEKKKQNYRAFFTKWLQREQDKGGTKGMIIPAAGQRSSQFMSKDQQRLHNTMQTFEEIKREEAEKNENTDNNLGNDGSIKYLGGGF